ncbi:coiled-coil domain-containing protein 66 isoform X5 [Vidua chalybeata]|uniref:coiled-coil domain-containing protein 66 isoform X5 n=1 Tax=Vidua chalybeata TaxID=81927 RepID=UPI0023A89AC2|nr:coiled-coil domain-containing protein 66 isoform X5 [Vidua chalybeata]
MNLGDGLKLETEVLDGKPRLILASSDKSKPAMKMGNKARAPKQALRIKHAGLILRPTQNACIKKENLTKPRSESSLSMTKGEKLQVNKHSSHEATTKGYSLIFQRDKTNRYPDSEDSSIVKKTKHKPQAPHVSAEDFKSLVCLTQAQLQQILMIVKEGRSISETHNEKQEEMAANEASEENVTASLQKDCDVSPVPDEINSDSGREQEAHPQPGQNVIKDSWKPADLFSTLGEREGEKALLEFKKTQWKKELDEQVALKKKLKETLEGEVGYFWAKIGSNKTPKVEAPDTDQTVLPAASVHGTEENSACTAALATEADGVALNVPRAPAGQSSDFSPSDFPAGSCTALGFREAVPQQRPFSALKHEQQKKWLEELDKQKEEAKLRKLEEKLNLSKAEEHDRWEMHFDSFKNRFNALGNLMPLQMGTAEKAAKNGALEQSQRVSFLRSMTALLDPAQIEERDRRRQKQLEHQKAIMAQVEEKRKQKQLEEEQRKWEEQQEELRLAREKAQLQKQFEEEMLKQRQKEELATLKARELYQTMEKAQELAQGSKQDQHIPDLAQKAHDISQLQKSLAGGDTEFDSCNSGISAQSTDFPAGVESPPEQQASPRKDTAVQTDCFNTSAYTESAEERTACCESPDISIEYKEMSNSKKYQKEMQYMDKNELPGKGTGGIYSDLYEQYARKERHIKSSEKYSKRRDWNINKPGKRYIPASERYPKPLQKQREENKVRRQMELLQLVERNSPGQLSARRGGHSARSLSPREETAVKSKGHRGRKEEKLHKNHLNEERSESPPVPAVRNRLLQEQQRQIQASHFLVYNQLGGREKDGQAASQQRSSPAAVAEPRSPRSAQFVPYVRTREVFCLQPEAPLSLASPRHTHDSYQMPRQIFSSDHVRDAVRNPDVVTIRERQQEILKGLSKLRQGLLQKQKELENTLIPIVAQENFMPPF